MGTNPRQTAAEIEETREELARKVDELVDRAKVEAQEAGKKMAVGFGALILLLLIGMFAKRRVGS
jgi:hypothetical protein